MTLPRKPTVRCAIYTRKSSEEGLEQGFNSLEAQREACEAYIKSQAHEGWRVLPERFDDGGHSGGTIDRPAVQRLLDRVRERRVDVIVLYKIDRLTRSLTDFARLAELFDQHGVSFVSVTQQFNTTTSMGRLMLNVLLSFAQFEREITGERIRDKVAASKKKGMWMGGWVSLGYEVKDRALVINKEEAKTVRAVFRLYLAHGNVRRVKEEADRIDLKTKVWRTTNNQPRGGRPLSRGHIYALLNNHLYAGRIRHKDQVHPGVHKAIIDPAIWDEVQRRLRDNLQGESKRTRSQTQNPLTGLLFDAEGNRFTPSHSVKAGKRYRYYVDRALITGEVPSAKVRRIPAAEIEGAVRVGIVGLLGDSTQLLQAVGGSLDTTATSHVIRQGRRVREKLLEGGAAASIDAIRSILARVILDTGTILLQVRRDGLRGLLALPAVGDAALTDGNDAASGLFEFAIPTRITTSGMRMKLVVTDSRAQASKQDPTLVKAITRAHDWFARLQSGEAASVRQIAKAECVTETYVGHVLRLAFLAPGIVETILDGRQPADMTAKDLLLRQRLPSGWGHQCRQLRFNAA